MIFYLRRRPLSLLLIVHANIPLRLPLRNAIRQSVIYRQSIAASAPLVPVKPTEGAGAWLLLRARCCTVTVVPLLPAKAREKVRAWLLLRQRCTVAAVVPLLPAKAREGAGAWLLLRRQRCTVAAVVPLLPAKATEEAGGWLAGAAATVMYRRRRCSVARTVSLDNNDYRCTAAETAGYAPRASSPRAQLVCIARTRFPKPGRRNVAPVAVAAGKTNAAVGDDCRVAHKFPSSWPFCLLYFFVEVQISVQI